MENNKEVLEFNSGYYKEIEKRIATAVYNAKQFLESVEQNSDNLLLIQQFEFPLAEGHPVPNE